MGEHLIRVTGEEALSGVSPLFAYWDETMIWTCLQDEMGSVWTYGRQAALCQCGDILFLAFSGTDRLKLLQELKRWLDGRFGILACQDEELMALVPQVFGDAASARDRFAFHKGGESFEPFRLQRYAGSLPPDVQLRLFDEELYHQAMEEDWSRDFCSQYASAQDYLKRGLGVGAVKDGRLVGGASSYISYHGGIEIEVDVLKEFRGRGIASACSARLILECLERGLYPSWDAANSISVRLAQKLGYRLRGSYPVWHLNET